MQIDQENPLSTTPPTISLPPISNKRPLKETKAASLARIFHHTAILS
jgi:hypothetical protein